MQRRAGAFTLIEVLAVVFLTAIVLGIALDFYVDLSRGSTRAADKTRDLRRSAAALDRIARDFEAAMLVEKREEEDPLAHPWLFVAESRGSDTGADHIKFITRNHRPRSSEAHEQDLAVVAYTLRQSEEDEDAYELMRWASPRLPESLDRSFPRDEDEESLLLADGVASFGVRFLAEDGQWSDEWDSTTLVRSGQLPEAVEIELAMLPDQATDRAPVSFTRRVRLPVRPLDLEELLDPEAYAFGSGETESGEDEAEEEGEEAGEETVASSGGASPSDAQSEGPTSCYTLGEALDPAAAAAAGLDLSDPFIAAFLKQPYRYGQIPANMLRAGCR
jgi:type II secretion system protein J